MNEPETSLHPDLLEPLGELIAAMPRESQLWVTTHARELADSVGKRTGTEPVRLTKQNGETRIVGQRLVDVEPDEDPE